MVLMFKGLEDNRGDWERELKSRVPNLEIRVWPDVGDVDEIDVALVWRPPRGDLMRYPNLRAILNIGAGVDYLLADPDLPEGVPIARMVDPGLTLQMSTYILHSVIRHHRRMDTFDQCQREAAWCYERALDNGACRVGVMGLGVLGSDAACRLRDLGFRVAGWSRTPRRIEGIDCHAGHDRLFPFLSGCRILVCLLPQTPHTESILNATVFGALPQGAYIVNTSRGALLVEDDLLAAIDSGHLAGATLDVFRTEPLPPDHVFWRHPRIHVTPHIASNTNPASAASQVAENIRRATQGLPLLHEVDRAMGY